MADTRKKDADWKLRFLNDGRVETTEMAVLATLMDLRDELKKLNRVLECPNFLEIPYTLRMIRKNTTKPERKRKS